MQTPETNKIHHGHCLDHLRSWPDNFLDCVVTSPPYYGLRSYGTEPQVWDGDPKCEHSWGEALPYAKQDNRTLEQKIAQGATVGSNQSFNNENTTATSGSFCGKCPAWHGELGLEPTFQLYISHLIDIFREVKRVLKPSGTVWVNLGDSYGHGTGSDRQQSSNPGVGANNEKAQNSVPRNGGLAKSLMNIPARFAIAMTDELQFIQRNEIIWHKPACMPSSAKDRFTIDYEPIFFFTKNRKYWFEQQRIPAIGASGWAKQRGKGEHHERQKGDSGFVNDAATGTTIDTWTDTGDRNMRTVWKVNFEPQSEEHYASYPTRLIEIPIKAGCPENGIVYDPFGGTATTALVAHRLGRQWICSELQPKYVEIANERLEPHLAQPDLFAVDVK
jgi:site-specific DNA-methyltransferase (adenine-specific)